MDNENEKNESPKQQMVGESGSDSAAVKNTIKRGAEVLGQAEEAVSEAYDKTAKAVNETYQQAKSYGSHNPGKTLLIAFGIGVGVGLLLGAGSHRSRTGRFAEPVVNALSDIALEFFS